MTLLHKIDDSRAVFWCPGCDESHQVFIAGERAWQFNGDYEKPTLSPSYLTWVEPNASAEPKHDPTGKYRNGLRCHSFIKDGKIEFLNDCTHKLTGMTVDLPDWETAQ